MYDRILVPLDGGPRGEVALHVAERLADQWSADLEVLSLLTLGDDLYARERVVEEQTKQLHRRSRTVIRPVHYTVADEIIDEIDLGERTLLVMSTTARSRASGIVGSTAEDVLQFAEEPVLLVGPKVEIDDAWPTGPMYVCTDGSKFAESIVPKAAEIASGLSMHPWVITVTDPITAKNQVSLAAESAHPAQVARAMAEDVGEAVDFEVLHNKNPAHGIVEYARDHNAGMIALATHGETGIRRLTIGSVAIGVVHAADCPVLVTHPREAT